MTTRIDAQSPETNARTSAIVVLPGTPGTCDLPTTRLGPTDGAEGR